MDEPLKPGQVVILNGAPRSGKSSIVEVIQRDFDDVWLNLGVDVFARSIIPRRLAPAIGLRPGGELPALEPVVEILYAAMYESIAAHSRLGLNVVVDVGHHDGYSRPLGILRDCAARLVGLPVLFVGVRCPLDVIMQRRNQGQGGREGTYLRGTDTDPVPMPVRRWQEAVHAPGIYDIEVDTSLLSPVECAGVIRKALASPPSPSAIERLLNADEAGPV